MSTFTIRRASADDIALVAPLFHAYRQFYRREDGQARAQEFIEQRLQQQDTVVYLATTPSGEALGFAQLFPTFSSTSAKTAWVLNDLYVQLEARQQGVAKALVEQALAHVKASGAAWVSLKTACDNHSAQALYRSLGFVQDEKFLAFQMDFV